MTDLAGCWTLVLCDGSGNELCDVTGATGKRLSFKRNGVPECSLALSHHDEEAGILLEALANGTGGGVPTLKGYRTGPDGTKVLRFNGYLAPFQEDVSDEGSILAANFRGPFGRLLGDGPNRGLFLAAPLSFTGGDAGQIARQILLAITPVGSDAFTGAVGNLNGRVTTALGTWSTSGSATDFSASADTMIRTASGTRYAIVPGPWGAVTAQVDWKQNTDVAGQVRALTARWTDSNNYVALRISPDIGFGGPLEIVKVVGGVVTVLASTSIIIVNNFFYTLNLQVADDGSCTGQMTNGTTGELVAALTADADPSIAPGGVLSSGGAGFYTTEPFGTATTIFDNFAVSTPDFSVSFIAAGDIEPTKTRDRSYPIGTNRGEAIVNLTNVLDGFDFEVVPVDNGTILGDFTVYARQGSDRADATFHYGPRTLANCRGLRRETIPPANFVRVIGGNGLVGQKYDAASIAKYDRWEYLESAGDVSEQATLDDKAQALVRPDPIKVIRFTPDPENAPRPWDDFWLGDSVPFYANDDAVREEAIVRINEVQIVIDDNTGREAYEIPDPTTPNEEATLRASLAAEVV